MYKVLLAIVAVTNAYSSSITSPGSITVIDCETPKDENPRNIQAFGKTHTIRQMGLKSYQGSIKRLIEHCKDVIKHSGTGSIFAYRGQPDGLGYCVPDSGDKCFPYSTCSLTLAAKEQISSTHIEIDNYILVTEPTNIRSFTENFNISFGLIKRDSAFRACPENKTPSTHYFLKDSSDCSYIHGNGDSVSHYPLPLSELIFNYNLVSSDELYSGEWRKTLLSRGISGVESQAFRLLKKHEMDTLIKTQPVKNDSLIALESKIMELETKLEKLSEQLTIETTTRTTKKDEKIESTTFKEVTSTKKVNMTVIEPACTGYGSDLKVIAWSSCGRGRILTLFGNLVSLIMILMMFVTFTSWIMRKMICRPTTGRDVHMGYMDSHVV